MVDVAAIDEAVTRPSMRFVQIRQPEQSAQQALPIVHTICTGETGIQWVMRLKKRRDILQARFSPQCLIAGQRVFAP